MNLDSPPEDLAEKLPKYGTIPRSEWVKLSRVHHPKCNHTSPAWGYEAESEECQRRPHDDPWHYFADEWVTIWWKETI